MNPMILKFSFNFLFISKTSYPSQLFAGLIKINISQKFTVFNLSPFSLHHPFDARAVVALGEDAGHVDGERV